MSTSRQNQVEPSNFVLLGFVYFFLWGAGGVDESASIIIFSKKVGRWMGGLLVMISLVSVHLARDLPTGTEHGKKAS